MATEQKNSIDMYQGVADIRLETYLRNTERSVIANIPVWPLRIREWALTPVGEASIRNHLRISRTNFLWLETQVNLRKIIHIDDLRNNGYHETRLIDSSHNILADEFRAFTFLTWGFPMFKNRSSEIDDWDKFITEIKSSGGSNKLVNLIHDPIPKLMKVRGKAAVPPTGSDGTPPKTEPPQRRWYGDYKNPSFDLEEMAELSSVSFYDLRIFLDDKNRRMRQVKAFENNTDEDLDISDTKIRALCFINGVRKKLLRYQMRVRVEEAKKQGRQSLYEPEKVQVIFDPNNVSLDNILETAEFTQKVMEEKKINLYKAFKFMEQINEKLED